VQGLLGDVARRRAELIARLTAEGLLDSNKQSHFHRSRCASDWSPVLVRRATATSPVSCSTPATASRSYSSRARCRVKRRRPKSSRRLRRSTNTVSTSSASCAVVAPRVTSPVRRRAGGSRDRGVFDPIFTGIGHTGDESIADLVAHTRAITPPNWVKRFGIVANWHVRHVRLPAQRVLDATTAVLDEATEYVAERRRT